MKKLYGKEMGVTLDHLKELVAKLGKADKLTTDKMGEKARACFQLAYSAGDLIAEVERLQALEKSVEAMARMLNEREWAEHVGVGVAGELEGEITAMHDDLTEAQEVAELYRVSRAIATDNEFVRSMDGIMHDDPIPAPIDGASYDQFMRLTRDRAQAAGLWPLKEVLH